MSEQACGASNESIGGGAPCIYLRGHEGAGLPHTTRGGLWWTEAAPTPPPPGVAAGAGGGES